MPRFDGTGPWGMSPGAGWGLGPCGLGLRRGYSRVSGRGFRRLWTKQDEVAALEEESKALEQELTAVKEELKSLKDQK